MIWVMTVTKKCTAEGCEGGKVECWEDTTDNNYEHTTRHWIEDCEECEGTGELEHEDY